MKTLPLALAGFVAVTAAGCIGSGFSVRPEAAITVWYGQVGVRTQYVNPDSVCITALWRADTTDAAPVSTVAGPACFNAYEYVRSFFPADTTQGEIPDAEPPTPLESTYRL